MQTLNNINYIFSRRNKKAAAVLKALGRKEFCYHNWNDKRIDELAPEELVVLAQSITKK
jgi:16S rRNA A1518/A1519 N6-dimethyltransferase RsmA/KsgA/DIM1 with predicted DNA glycosylase/AP lyase activity